MEIVDRQLDHLARMVDDLLDVSRITRGRIILKKQNLNLSTALESAITASRAVLDSRRHRFSVDMAGTDLWIDADPVRLEQIVTNLLTNAAKYTPSDGRVWLSAHREQSSVVIHIRDNGMGIASDQIDKMFDLFAQGNRSLARSEGGLGIGLTVARSLTELHGGTLVASSPGLNQGSQFTITLPAATPAPESAEPRQAHPASTTRKGGSRVMIIDDNIDLARGMAGLLKHLNHQVWVAYDGPSGLEAVRAHRPEVVLLDIGLPGMDGFEVADLLRREEFGKDVLLIAVTGYGQEEDRQHAFSAGFDHFVTKPVDYPTLLALMVGNSPAQ
jgi:CheY-like chemotaxis protein/two-component sensor histidine kinase